MKTPVPPVRRRRLAALLTGASLIALLAAIPPAQAEAPAGADGATTAAAAEAATTAAIAPAVEAHAAAVVEVVQGLIAPPPNEAERARLARIEEMIRARQGAEAAAGRIVPIDRRGAALLALERNLSLSVARRDPAKAEDLLREARAVFHPVFNISIGYSRDDTYERTKLGTVNRRAVIFGEPPFLELFKPRAEDPDPQVFALYFRNFFRQDGVEKLIVASPGRTNGALDEKVIFTLGVTQQLPWGGTLTVTDETTQQKPYYRSGHYFRDGQWSTDLSASLNMPLPFTKNFGRDNPNQAQIAIAEVTRERADWQVKAVVNDVLRQADQAFFEVAQRLEALESTLENRDLVAAQRDRINRLFDLGQVTRYQKAQMEAEAEKAEIRVEQALTELILASQRLALLIGEPEAAEAQMLFLPYGYAPLLDRIDAPTSLAAAMAVAKENRPDFFIEGLNQRIAEISLAAAENQARPDLVLSLAGIAGQNGSTFGYASPLDSHGSVTDPDTVNASAGLTYTYPLYKRAANAAVGRARIERDNQELVQRAVETAVRRDIAQSLAAAQSARARVALAQSELENMQVAYESLERRHRLVGSVSENELIDAARRLLNARLSLIQARIDSKQAESALLAAQGIIAQALPEQTAASALEQRRLRQLAAAGYLQYFGAPVAADD